MERVLNPTAKRRRSGELPALKDGAFPVEAEPNGDFGDEERAADAEHDRELGRRLHRDADAGGEAGESGREQRA